MTKEEILKLIAENIEGQGNQIDSGSKLPPILRGIIDLIPAAPEPGGGGIEEVTYDDFSALESLEQGKWYLITDYVGQNVENSAGINVKLLLFASETDEEVSAILEGYAYSNDLNNPYKIRYQRNGNWIIWMQDIYTLNEAPWDIVNARTSCYPIIATSEDGDYLGLEGLLVPEAVSLPYDYEFNFDGEAELLPTFADGCSSCRIIMTREYYYGYQPIIVGDGCCNLVLQKSVPNAGAIYGGRDINIPCLDGNFVLKFDESEANGYNIYAKNNIYGHLVGKVEVSVSEDISLNVQNSRIINAGGLITGSYIEVENSIVSIKNCNLVTVINSESSISLEECENIEIKGGTAELVSANNVKIGKNSSITATDEYTLQDIVVEESSEVSFSGDCEKIKIGNNSAAIVISGSSFVKVGDNCSDNQIINSTKVEISDYSESNVINNCENVRLKGVSNNINSGTNVDIEGENNSIDDLGTTGTTPCSNISIKGNGNELYPSNTSTMDGIKIEGNLNNVSSNDDNQAIGISIVGNSNGVFGTNIKINGNSNLFDGTFEYVDIVGNSNQFNGASVANVKILYSDQMQISNELSNVVFIAMPSNYEVTEDMDLVVMVNGQIINANA